MVSKRSGAPRPAARLRPVRPHGSHSPLPVARTRGRGSFEPDLAVAVEGLRRRGGLEARGCDRVATEVVEHIDTQAGAVGGRQQPRDQRRGDVQPVRDALQEQRAGLGHTRPADQLAVFGKDDNPRQLVGSL